MRRGPRCFRGSRSGCSLGPAVGGLCSCVRSVGDSLQVNGTESQTAARAGEMPSQYITWWPMGDGASKKDCCDGIDLRGPLGFCILLLSTGYLLADAAISWLFVTIDDGLWETAMPSAPVRSATLFAWWLAATISSTPSWSQAIGNAPYAVDGATVAYWRFEDPAGTTVADQTGVNPGSPAATPAS